MEIMTHLAYEDVFNHAEKGGLTIPLSCLGDEGVVDEIIDELISGLDPIEAISYSSFLNMIVQTCEPEESARLGRNEIAAVGFKKNIPANKVFFHRDCLLHMMSRIITGGKDGTIRITGTNNRRGATKYYKALLLINSKINSAGKNALYTLLKNYLIRDYPPSHSPKTTNIIFKNRLQRYWYVYNKALSQMECHGRSVISQGINNLEEDSDLTLREQYSVLASTLNWFLLLPMRRQEMQNKETTALGFDYRNIGSFYIRKNNFGEPDQFVRLINFLAADKHRLQKLFDKNRRDEAIGFYRHFRDFFDQPVFKIDNDNFCIFDLKFLLEGLCSGFLWRIKDRSSLHNIYQELKGYYGQLLEEYFVFLLKQIFGHAKISKTPGSGPDCIVEFGEIMFIFEFTTEYYRFSSLYRESTDFMMQDLHRLLFNQGKGDPCGRNKTDKGKFLKLNEYLEKENSGKKIFIPVLVTENYLGDYDLLNRFENFVDKKVNRYGLTNIQKYKPLIICLDDLEVFWALSTEDKAMQEFKAFAQAWEESDKGRFSYNFSYFISSPIEAVIKNEAYVDFFNYSNFLGDLAGAPEESNKDKERKQT